MGKKCFRLLFLSPLYVDAALRSLASFWQFCDAPSAMPI